MHLELLRKIATTKNLKNIEQLIKGTTQRFGK
jgi:hypothetical protein